MSSRTSLASSASQHPITRTPSNSSIASSSSGASLTRRPGIRARSRSRTVAGNAQKSSKTHSTELPYLEKPYSLEPSSYTPQEQHLRPPESDVFDTRDLRGRASGSLQGSCESGGQDVTMVADTQPSPMIAKVPKAAERASSLPDIVTSHNLPPSAFFHDAPMTPVANVRDSVSTQKSNTSSSVYPFSASSASGPVSPISPTSLRPLSEDIEHFEMEPEVEDGTPDFDPDDVSYRLRLLVKNNYFLPPAHSKPMLSDLSPVEPKKPSRAATPAFLDIFNKLKSKPQSPVGAGFESNLPLLRSTGDTTPHTPQSRPSMQTPRASGSPNGIGTERAGRVVVVREKMEDLAVAAKQAEHEMKTRSVRREVEPANIHVFDNIDPTDAVDVPPPPSSYPFPMQTSTLHGLGVEESVSAAVLAEHLPPSSPGMSSIGPAEEDWRRSLLQAAVHHSLENTADLSSYSPALDLSSSAGSPNPTYPRVMDVEASPTPDPRHRLGQRILQQPFSESSESFGDEDQKETGKAQSPTACTTEYLSADSRLSSRPSSYFLARVETPTDPWTALTPPPPRKQVNPLVSQSQIDLTTTLPTDPTEQECRASTPTLRKTVSTPMLSAKRITPPPLPPSGIYIQDSHEQGRSHNTSREAERSQSTVTDSMYSDEDFADQSRRGSAALSALMSRPSLSDYSRDSLSPTTSAFQEDLNNATQAYSPLAMTFQAAQQARINRASSVPRDSTMSPPPRISSSLAHVALPPPPRGSSLRHPSLPIESTLHSLLDTKASLDSVINEFVIQAPTPTTPQSKRREDLPRPSQTEKNVETTLHTAPEPSSPTSFFDNIQSQPNALDDLDSSSDESDIVHVAGFTDMRSRTMSNVATPPRSSLMRLGNHSSPHISRATRSAEEQRIPLPFGVQDPKQPIANVPHRKPFFIQQLSGKSDQSLGAPVSSFDFYQYSRQRASGASIDANVPKPKRPATPSLEMTRTDSVDESLRRLDGLLQQHMVAEKDTIRRIAQTLQSSNTQRTRTSETKR